MTSSCFSDFQPTGSQEKLKFGGLIDDKQASVQSVIYFQDVRMSSEFMGKKKTEAGTQMPPPSLSVGCHPQGAITGASHKPPTIPSHLQTDENIANECA